MTAKECLGNEDIQEFAQEEGVEFSLDPKDENIVIIKKDNLYERVNCTATRGWDTFFTIHSAACKLVEEWWRNQPIEERRENEVILF